MRDASGRNVSSIVLDNGRDFSARDIRIVDDVVFLERPSDAGLASTVRTYGDGTEVERRNDLGRPSFDEHRDNFRRHHSTAFADRCGAYDDLGAEGTRTRISVRQPGSSTGATGTDRRGGDRKQTGPNDLPRT